MTKRLIRSKPERAPRDAAPPLARTRWAVAAGLVVAILLTFSPVFHGQFLNYDDQEAIARNPDYLDPEHADLSHYWGRAYLGLYTPVSYILLGWVAPLAQVPSTSGDAGSLDPGPFHAANVLLHAMSMLWVYLLLQSILRAAGVGGRAAVFAAGGGAMLFAVHPIQAETVAWATSFNTLLGGMLMLWALWHGWHYTELSRQNSTDPATRKRRRIHWCAGFILFVLATLSKPSAIMAPILLAVLVRLILRAPWRSVFLFLLPWALAAVPVAIMTKLSQPTDGATGPPLAIRPLVAADSLSFYLAKIIWPVPLLPDYGRTPEAAIAHGWVYWTWIAAFAVALLAWALCRRLPALLAGSLIFVAALFPVLGLTSFQHQTISTVADRYAYVAMLGPALLAAFLAARLLDCRPARARLMITGAAAVLVLLAISTFRQTSLWHNDQRLFSYTLKHHPGSLTAHRVLGFDAAQRGDTAGAIAHFEQALRTRPGDGFAEYNLGNLYLMMQRPADAIPHLRVASLEITSRAPLFNNLGISLLMTGRVPEALDAFGRATRLDPPSADAHVNIAAILVDRGDYQGALAHYDRALAINPNLPAAQRGLAQLSQMLQARQGTFPRPPSSPQTGPTTGVPR